MYIPSESTDDLDHKTYGRLLSQKQSPTSIVGQPKETNSEFNWFRDETVWLDGIEHYPIEFELLNSDDS